MLFRITHSHHSRSVANNKKRQRRQKVSTVILLVDLTQYIFINQISSLRPIHPMANFLFDALFYSTRVDSWITVQLDICEVGLRDTVLGGEPYKRFGMDEYLQHQTQFTTPQR
jgi:hypothetical protein